MICIHRLTTENYAMNRVPDATPTKNYLCFKGDNTLPPRTVGWEMHAYGQQIHSSREVEMCCSTRSGVGAGLHVFKRECWSVICVILKIERFWDELPIAALWYGYSISLINCGFRRDSLQMIDQYPFISAILGNVVKLAENNLLTLKRIWSRADQ